MRKALLLTTALTLGALNPAFAGGPVVIEDEVVEVTRPVSSVGWVLPLLVVIAVVAIASGDDDDEDEDVQLSDIRLKEDVQRIGTNRLGLGVYRYRYRGLDGVYEGVLAQEVEVMHPGAVRTLPYGFKAVDYAKLGLELRRVA